MISKDYKLLAAALRASQPARWLDSSHTQLTVSHVQWAWDVNSIAEALACDNPRFDIVRFVQACGGYES